MAQWEADITLTQEDAGRLVERRFPELAPARLEPLGAGWDNAAYVVNGRWVFRFPRRKAFAGLLENEMRYLPRLAPHLPLRIPEPVWHGRPEEAFPYPFAGYELLPGETACAVAWTPEERLRNAPLLGRLQALGAVVGDRDRDWEPRTRLRHTLVARLDRPRQRIGGLRAGIRGPHQAAQERPNEPTDHLRSLHLFTFVQRCLS